MALAVTDTKRDCRRSKHQGQSGQPEDVFKACSQPGAREGNVVNEAKPNLDCSEKQASYCN